MQHPSNDVEVVCVSIQGADFYFRVFIMAATVSFGRPWASSIYSIFPLCMESNALEKSINNIVAS